MKPLIKKINEILPNQEEYNVLPFVYNDAIHYLKNLIKTGTRDFKYGLYTIMDIASKLSKLPDDKIEEKLNRAVKLVKLSFNPDECDSSFDDYVKEIIRFLVRYLRFYGNPDVKKIIVMNNYAVFLH